MTVSSMPNANSASLPRAARPSFEAFFSYGFRPFFLGAAVYAALVMAVWLAWIAAAATGWSQSWLPVAGSAFSWHAHEMVFGFSAAAIGGFLLTAVPNWTGALPLSGPPLIILFVVWAVGRVAMGLSAILPYPLVVALDVAFLPILGAFAARQLFTRIAARNLIFLVIVAALTLCNIIFHLGNAGYLAADPLAAIRTSILIVVVMIAVIGGRIIPAFTHNWLNGKQTSERMPLRIPWLEKAAPASLVVFVVLDAAGLPDVLLGTVALIAAVANGARLVLWRGVATRTEPIVLVLHIGYAWIVIGLAVSALAAFTGTIPSAIVTHAFGTGAIGTMIIAVMSRASLGHTGRRIIAPQSIVWAYHLITIAAVLRIGAPFVPSELYTVALTTAALAWIGAFVLFTKVYASILTTPRVHAKIARP